MGIMKCIKQYIFISLFAVLLFSCESGGRYTEEGGISEMQANLAATAGDYVLFGLDSSALDHRARSIIDAQSQWLKENDMVEIVIEGHCDARGTREYNLALGAKRANATRNYLIAKGIHPDRISTVSYGKEKPTINGSGPEVWRENRRAVTLVN